MPTMTPEYREYVLERIQESKKENMTIEKCQEELKMKQARYETLISRSSIADKIYARNSVQSSIFYWECVIEVLTELAEQEQELEPVAEVVEVVEVVEVAPVKPVRRNCCSYNRATIMKRAWQIKKEHQENVFSLCLKMAWKEAKYTVADLEIGDTVELSLHYTFQKARALYYKVEAISKTLVHDYYYAVTLSNQFREVTKYFMLPDKQVKLISKASEVEKVA